MHGQTWGKFKGTATVYLIKSVDKNHWGPTKTMVEQLVAAKDWVGVVQHCEELELRGNQANCNFTACIVVVFTVTSRLYAFPVTSLFQSRSSLLAPEPTAFQSVSTMPSHVLCHSLDRCIYLQHSDVNIEFAQVWLQGFCFRCRQHFHSRTLVMKCP